MRKPSDLKGKRFGRLVAEYPTSRRDHKGSVYWHCRCDCGNEIEVTADGLMSRNNLSCGCLKRENQENIHNMLHRVDGTCLEWLSRKKPRKDNICGYTGINRIQSGKYRASIGFKGQRYYLGTYKNLEDAIAAREKAGRDIHDAFRETYAEWQKLAAADPEWAEENPLVFRVEKEPHGCYRVITSPVLTKEEVQDVEGNR